MLPLRLRETKKLHYNQYVYKVGIHTGLASYFRTELQRGGKLSWAKQKLDEINANIQPNDNFVNMPRGRFSYSVAIQDFYNAISLYRVLKKHEDYKIRVEINYLFVYTNDRSFCTKIINNCTVVEFWEPDPANLEIIQSEKNLILVNKPPMYEYKLTFGKKLGSSSLANWIDNNPNLAKIGDVAKTECYNEGWVKGFYFFVRDKKTLLVAQLIVGDNIQRVEKLVYVPD